MKIYSSRHTVRPNNTLSTYEQLKSFAGKDAWIRLGINTAYELYYVRIVEITTLDMRCSKFAARLIDSQEDYATIPSDLKELDFVWTIDLWDIYLPKDGKFEVLSTEELTEMIKQNMIGG